MFSVLFYSDLDRHIVSDNSVLFMDLKFHKLVLDLQSFSRSGLEQVVQHVEVQLDWSEATDVIGLGVTMFFNDLVDNFMRGNADKFGLDKSQREEGKINAFGINKRKQNGVRWKHLEGFHNVGRNKNTELN